MTEFRCSEILRASRKVFAEKGFADATVDDIAEAAELAKGTLYLYFPSKRELYLAALKNGIREMVERSQTAMAAAGGIREKLRVLIRTRLEEVERNRDFFKIYHSEFGNIAHPAAGSEWFLNLYQEQLRMLSGMLTEAAAAGEIRLERIETVASAIYEMTRGVMLRRTLGLSTGDVEEDVDTLDEIIWNGMGKK
ncbi:MAG TPA: TetR/AcrR family transcriptional regulator [Bryobacteraceae bacterium]|nr:TetR/AcrR family transcriptional regulator [Bryobacteraceae bacterium]